MKLKDQDHAAKNTMLLLYADLWCAHGTETDLQCYFDLECLSTTELDIARYGMGGCNLFLSLQKKMLNFVSNMTDRSNATAYLYKHKTGKAINLKLI